MVLQHQMAFDFLTAVRLCVMLNTKCCTYIPDYVYSPNMTISVNNLKNVRVIAEEDKPPKDWNLFALLTSGPL